MTTLFDLLIVCCIIIRSAISNWLKKQIRRIVRQAVSFVCGEMIRIPMPIRTSFPIDSIDPDNSIDSDNTEKSPPKARNGEKDVSNLKPGSP